jgi:hypothetical protein
MDRALADADLDGARAVRQGRMTACQPADPDGTVARLGGDAAVGAVDVETAAAADEIEVGRGVTDPDLPARAGEPDSAPGLADPYRDGAAFDVGAPGDVADRDLTSRDVRVQRVDAVQLDPTLRHVQLALAK